MSSKTISVMVLDATAERSMKIKEIPNTYEALRKEIGSAIDTGWRITPSKEAQLSGVVSYDVYVSDEGLLSQPEFFVQVMARGEYSRPLAGKAVIVASNEEGESVRVDPNELILNMKIKAAFITPELKEEWNSIVSWMEEAYGTSYEVQAV